MKDPGPNVLEQQIETNRLLALILAAGGDGAPSGASYPGVSGGGRCQWPALFRMSDPDGNPFICTCSDASTVALTSLDAQCLSLGSALRVDIAPGTGKKCNCTKGLPMGPLECPRVQLAWTDTQWPTQSEIFIKLIYDNGTNLLTAGVKLNEQDYSLAYFNNGGGWTTIASDEWDYKGYDWKKIDLAVNFPDTLYSGIGVNQYWHDLSAIAMLSGVSSTKKSLRMEIQIENHSADNPIVAFLDEILVTDELYTGPAE